MIATTSIEVRTGADGRSVLHTLRCESPLLARCTQRDGPLTISLVGGAAAPLGGDDLRLHIVVRAGAQVNVRSVAAMLAQPGPRYGESRLYTSIIVEDDAELDWKVEPLISVQGSTHHSRTDLDADPTARIRLTEATVLGRHDEPGGVADLRLRASVDGSVVLDTAVMAGEPLLHGVGAHGGFRWLWSELLLGYSSSAVHDRPSSEPSVDTVFHLDSHSVDRSASLRVCTGVGPWSSRLPVDQSAADRGVGPRFG